METVFLMFYCLTDPGRENGYGLGKSYNRTVGLGLSVALGIMRRTKLTSDLVCVGGSSKWLPLLRKFLSANRSGN